MNTYYTVSWRQRFVVKAAAIVVGSGTLEVVTSAMKLPAPEFDGDAPASSRSAERARVKLRTPQQGELKVAAITKARRI